MGGTSIESLLASDPPLLKYKWNQRKGWCNDSTDCAPPLDQVTINQVMAERVILYWRVPQRRENIPVTIYPLPIYYSLPSESEV